MKKAKQTTEPATEAPIIFDVSKTVKAYFRDVIVVKDFVIAVDELGVFFFTTNTDEHSVLIKLSNYLEALSISKQEIVVCQLDWNAQRIGDEVFFNRIPDDRFDSLLFVPVNPDDFEATIRLLLCVREPVLLEQEIDSIVECFQQCSSRKGSLYEFLANKGYDDIDIQCVKQIESLPVVTINDVISVFDVDGTSVQGIYETICEYRNLNQHDSPDTSLLSRIKLFRDSTGMTYRSTVILCSVFCFLSCFVSFFFHIPVLGVIFSVMGFLQARHLALMYSSSIAVALTWFSVAALIYSVFCTIEIYFPSIVKALQDLLLVAREV